MLQHRQQQQHQHQHQHQQQQQQQVRSGCRALKGSRGPACVSGPKYRGVSEALRLVIREEGLQGLWKGNGVNAMRAAACYAIKFPANDLAKGALGTRSGSSKNNSLGSLLLAGAIAGSLQKTFSYPLDFLSVRIAIGINASALGRPEPLTDASAGRNSNVKGYEGIRDCVKRVWRLEGPRGFFKGYSLAILSGVPYVMLQMAFFDVAKK